MSKQNEKSITDQLQGLYEQLNDVGEKLWKKEIELAKVKYKYYETKAYHTTSDNIASLRSADLRDAETTLFMERERITGVRRDLEAEVLELSRKYELLLEGSKILRAVLMQVDK